MDCLDATIENRKMEENSCSCETHICSLTSRICHMEELLEQMLGQLKMREEKKLRTYARIEKKLSGATEEANEDPSQEEAESTLPRIVETVVVEQPAGAPTISLHQAAKCKNTLAVARVLANGADPNVLDEVGDAALHCAARSGDTLATELLLACGASLDVQDVHGATPLSVAAWHGHKDIVDVLLEKGAQIDLPNKAGQTPLMCAILLQNAEMVAFLERKGASLDLVDGKGDKPLIIASKSCLVYALKVLINSPRISSKDVMQALTVAGDPQVFKILKRALPVSMICSTNFSLLPSLAKAGWAQPIELLLKDCERCADEDHLKNLQQAVAVTVSGPILLKLWRSKPIALRVPAMRRASAMGWFNALEVILDHWARDFGSVNHLHEVKEAMRVASSPEILRQILGIQGWLIKSSAGQEAFWIAAEQGWVHLLHFLIRKNIPLDAVRSDGATALHCAAAKGHIDCVKLLLKCGASTNLINDVGWTPLHVAADGGHNAVMKILLKAGADAAAKDPFGCTPFDVGIFFSLNAMKKHCS